MPRATGARTGQKHKKRKLAAPAAEGYASSQPRLAAISTAMAAAEAAVRVAEGDDAGVRSWLDDLLRQVERQHEWQQVQME